MSVSPVIHIVGARPNFMKAAPVLRALAQDGVPQLLVHTGQHFDDNMSRVFFRELDLPAPDVNLEVRAGSAAGQIAEIMRRLEPLLEKSKPVLVVVYGDVNSTVAAALTAAKMKIPVAHVEAGLRSFDRDMPEEINRLLTDQLSDILLTPSADGDENLLREGVAPDKIHRVGNVMIDTLVRMLPRTQQPSLETPREGYALVTLHRPSNVDDPDSLGGLVRALQEISRECPVFFPVHPRTRDRLSAMGGMNGGHNISLLSPLGYLDFLALMKKAAVVITDSGGLQEETTFLGVPCVTVRENTERPVTLSHGTNVLVGRDMEKLRNEVRRARNGEKKRGCDVPLWDGRAAERVSKVIQQWLSKNA